MSAVVVVAACFVGFVLGGIARTAQDRAYWRANHYCPTCNRLSTRHEAIFVGTEFEDGAG